MKKLPKQVKSALEKTRDSAILAVEVYNKPAVKFKSSAFISLMAIAWTSFFHAVFFKRKEKPYYKKENGRFEKIDGDCKHWELGECLSKYFKADVQNPIRKNLEFFIPLRNKIEHRYLPELDSSIFGECQAMLLNLDALIEKEFEKGYCLRESLSFALQMYPSAKSLGDAVKKNKSSQNVADFITQYRSSLGAETISSGQYAFKAFLIQVANHETQDTLPIQFVNYDKLPSEKRDEVAKLVALIKLKDPVVTNEGKLKPAEVVSRVQVGLGNPKVENKNGELVNRFNLDTHRRCWLRYKVRPSGKDPKADQINPRYCSYDGLYKHYSFTPSWVAFLISELKDEKKFNALY